MSDGPGQRFTRREGTDWLTDYITTAMSDGRHGTREAEAWFPKQAGTTPEPISGGFLVPEALRAEILRTALESSLIGPIDPNAPKPPPPSWRARLRRKRDAWRERAARRAYKIIAGDWPDNGEDDW